MLHIGNTYFENGTDCQFQIFQHYFLEWSTTFNLYAIDV